jgi:hypothetical protein
MTPELTRLLAMLTAGIVVVVLVVYWWTQRTPSVGAQDDAPLPLFGGIRPGERFTPPQPMSRIAPMRESPPATRIAPPARPAPAPAAEPVPPAPAVPYRVPPEPREEPPRPRPVIREFSTGPAPSPSLSPRPVPSPAPAVTPPPAPLRAPDPDIAPVNESVVVSPAGVPGTMVEGHALRFSIPAEGTLQFLPGRFEIRSGLDAGREIRFVHVPGPNGMELTFGRSEGELYRHIQLRDKTVSRQHARMQLRDGAWHLVNLSQTNPVAWNGTVLGTGQEQRLADGDRIEMGEVVFTFRSR